MTNEQNRDSLNALRGIQRYQRAIQIIVDRYPTSTLESMEEVFTALAIECLMDGNEIGLIQQQALAAVDSPQVQSILPPWRNQARQQPDEKSDD
jgi:hypothetical protein